MAEKNYNEARLELEGVEGPEADAMRQAALSALVELNLAEARFRMATGEHADAGSAIARARQFGATPEQLTATRRRSGGGAPPMG
ncbi:MAG: hypothetical protein H6742_16625 [Alphaproteobacteria bacterium]|nr:hypothetical protein [Alphaproteobacteria bacterium]